MDSFKLGKFRFKSLSLDGNRSISTDLSKDDAFGIYAYEFSDGTWYVGKSIDVRHRHVEHMHEYRHMNPPLLPVRMYWSIIRGTEQELDYAETNAIAGFEAKGYQLRNVMKAGRPRGDVEVIVDTGVGWGTPIPWERENLPSSVREFTFEPDDGKLKRFQRLSRMDCYPELIALLRYYVASTIPAPADTAATLWVVTALPSTSKGARLCTVSCQNAETLVILKADADCEEPHGFVNVKKPEGGRLPLWLKRERNEYGTLPKAHSLWFDSLEEAGRLLARRTALDACYRANAELMRRGASMYRRYNNPYLTQAILEGI